MLWLATNTTRRRGTYGFLFYYQSRRPNSSEHNPKIGHSTYLRTCQAAVAIKNQFTVKHSELTELAVTWAKCKVRHILSFFKEFSMIKTIFKSHSLSTARALPLLKHTLYLQVYFIIFSVLNFSLIKECVDQLSQEKLTLHFQQCY